jgi:Flp pilus assembly pilin Flp
LEKEMFKLWKVIRGDGKEATAIECGLIAAFAAIALITALSAISDSFTSASDTLAEETTKASAVEN